MSFRDSTWAVRCVWLRYFDVFRKNWVYGVVTTYLEPILYLLSFGYGMGGMIGSISVNGAEIPYRRYVMAGIVAQSLLFQGFLEAAYGSFVRMYYQRIFKAMATTPVTMSEVLWGELLWDATKAAFAASAVLVIGTITGDFNPWGALISLPFAYLAALLFAGLGMMSSSLSRTIEDIAYPNFLIVFPMFLFCGVYFPLEKLPTGASYIAWILPLTSVLSLLRTFLLGFPFQPQAVPIFIAWLVVLVVGSRRSMTRRLIR